MVLKPANCITYNLYWSTSPNKTKTFLITRTPKIQRLLDSAIHKMIYYYLMLKINNQTVHFLNLQWWDSIVVHFFDFLDFLVGKKNLGILFTPVSLLVTGVLFCLSFRLCLWVFDDLVFGLTLGHDFILLNFTLTDYPSILTRSDPHLWGRPRVASPFIIR